MHHLPWLHLWGWSEWGEVTTFLATTFFEYSLSQEYIALVKIKKNRRIIEINHFCCQCECLQTKQDSGDRTLKRKNRKQTHTHPPLVVSYFADGFSAPKLTS